MEALAPTLTNLAGPIAAAGAVVLVLGACCRVLPVADIYDALIVHMTARWYAAVLERLRARGSGARVLDVGIGTASALARNADAVRAQNLTVVGIDYEAAYIEKAARVVRDAGLAERVRVHCYSIYDIQPTRGLGAGEPFDAAYFSGSFTLMPDPAAALRAAASVLRPDGVIYVTQTFQNRPSPIMARVKPMLKHLTTVDFGQLTPHARISQIARDAGMEVLEDAPIRGSIDNAAQTARIIVLRPKSQQAANKSSPRGSARASHSPANRASRSPARADRNPARPSRR